ncbi:MAG: rhodanese-like domain-containing protein [Gammaproteobacteria bacterium]|nr:rhodanese-like domain-containing protein [Gammaproteobacteria bacterium]
MQQLIEFATNHYILVGGFVVVLALLIQDLITGGSSKDSVDPSGATELINNEDALVIDVRPAADFSKGHLINAQNIPMSGFAGQIDSLRKHQSRPIIINCNSGAQSASACRMLRKAGFERVFNLRGGILGWQNANFPVSRKRK